MGTQSACLIDFGTQWILFDTLSISMDINTVILKREKESTVENQFFFAVHFQYTLIVKVRIYFRAIFS